MNNNNIKFYQVLITNWHDPSLNYMYEHIWNYATLKEAMQCPWYNNEKNKHVNNGELFIDPITKEEKYQYNLQYIDNTGIATIELRHEQITEDSNSKVLVRRVLIKEIIL